MLKDLYVMKVDAKQELDNLNSPEALERFKQSIFVPSGVNIDSLLDGDRYFLTGEKGAGKTAMLIYTALKAEELFNAERAFIIFKEFSQEEKNDYSDLARITSYDQNTITTQDDYEFVWWWLFHCSIANAISSSTKEIFINNEYLDLYMAAVQALSSNPRGDKRRMPIITKDGYVEASLTVPVGGVLINLGGKINFEKSPINKNQVRFSTHIHELNRLFQMLDAGESQLYVIVDEMNLSTRNAEEYQRDIYMIRDLIIAIERFNVFSKGSHSNVRVIGSVRNEVITSVQSRGKEINKSIESYGIPIDWTQYREDSLKHPLIKLLINFFRMSGKSQGNVQILTDEEIYYKWVDEKIFYKPSYDLIRNYTLYRPRHVVRLLNLMKLTCPNSSKITNATFSEISRRYSSECWSEITEELSLYYSTKELIIIKEWLTGMPYLTNRSQMYTKACTNWTAGVSKELLSKFDDLLRDLYRVGVIGNINRMTTPVIQRWYFRGFETISTDMAIQIHKIFQSVLSTTNPESTMV